MADLASLIRVRKHAVEQKQKFLADLYRQAESLAARKRALEEEIAREREASDMLGTLDAPLIFARYADGVKKKIALLDAEAAKLEPRIRLAQEDVRTAFAELKKIEIINENRKAQEKSAAQKREDRMYDDIGIERFRKKTEEDQDKGRPKSK